MFLPAQLDVLGAEVPWRCTVAFGALGAASLIGLSDPGGGVTHDTDGHYTITFPTSQTVFVKAITMWAVAPSTGGQAHPHEIASGSIALHTTDPGGSQQDPPSGSRLYLSLILRNP